MTEQGKQVVELDAGAANEPGPRVYTAREIFVRRVLFYGGIMLWILVLAIPFSVFLLSIFGEFTFDVPGDYPGSEVRVWMVMERDERGIAYSRPQVVGREETAINIQTDVRYMLWEGESELIQYCQSYERESRDVAWASTGSDAGQCAR